MSSAGANVLVLPARRGSRKDTNDHGTKDKIVVVLRDLRSKANETKDKAVVLLRSPQFQTCTIATAGGSITLGAVGGAFGLASGVVVGAAAGVVPALFTFGLSIPAGAAIGGIGGLCGGTLLGGSSGGIAGFTTYKYRIGIKDGFMTVKVKARDTFNSTQEKAVMVLNMTRMRIGAAGGELQASASEIHGKAMERCITAVQLAKAKSSDALTFATTTRVGVTSSSAVAGAVVGGTSGGAFGTVAGAALGIVPAIFTFGLSIPTGAMLGLCVGTAVGGSTGAVGGGLVGYGGFTHRKNISEGVLSSWSKVSTSAKNLKTTAFTCAADAKESVKSMVRSSTGGSEHGNVD